MLASLGVETSLEHGLNPWPCQGYRGPAPALRLSMNRKALTIAAPNNTRRLPGREVRSVSAR